MPLPTTIKRGLSFCKSTDSNSHHPRSRPSGHPTQSSASALQRAIHKSTFLSGPAPPTTGTTLTAEHVCDFLDALSRPVSTPMLTTSIAKLPSPLSRHPKSLSADCLCDVHTWLDLRWIDELTDIVGGEIGPHLNHLRNAPDWLTSTETKEILGMLDPYVHIFPAPDPDGSRMANPYECKDPGCDVCNIVTCKACKLSMLFQNAEAVKALNICAKGRKRGGRPWPVACAWLDPLPPRPGWAAKWKKEGLPILSDRIIARRWRKSGRQERMTEGMKNVQAEVIADRDSAARVLDRVTREPVKSALVDSDSVYDEITGRQWSIRGGAMQSSATLSLLKKLGLDDDNGEEEVAEKKTVPWAKSYETLTGSQRSSVRGSIHHVGKDDDGDERGQAERGRQFDDALNDYCVAPVGDRSQSPNGTSLADQPRGRTSDSRTASNLAYAYDRGRPDSKAAPTCSRDSVSSWGSSGSGSSHGSRAPLPGNGGYTGHRSPYLEEGKDDGRSESRISRESWIYFNNSPLARIKSSGPQTQSIPSRSKVNLVEQAEHNSRFSTAPPILERSSARFSARSSVREKVTSQTRS